MLWTLFLSLSLLLLTTITSSDERPTLPKFGSGHWTNQNFRNEKDSLRNVAANHPVSKYQVFDFISEFFHFHQRQQKDGGK